jgi:hypothetical protein
MREELEKECRKLFRQMISADFPEYHEDKEQTDPKHHKYVRTQKHPSGIWLHIVLHLDPLHDKFTVEGGWDYRGRLPELDILWPDEKEKIFEHPILFRLNPFWTGRDYWWPVYPGSRELEHIIPSPEVPIEECLPLIAPAVHDAGQRIKSHLLPIFEEVIARCGNQAGG